MTTQRRDWEDLSELDAYWAILSDPARRHGGWDVESFLERGRCDVAEIMLEAERLGLPTLRDRALDFGCGAGRLTQALGQSFRDCVGVDISDQMVEEARRLAAGAPNCRFVVSDAPDLGVFDDGSFDFVLSLIVLQHVPGREAKLRYVAEFVRVLRPGGLLHFQLPSRIPLRNRLQPRPRLYGALRGAGIGAETLYKKLNLTPIRMTAVALAEIAAHVEGAGGRVLNATERAAHGGYTSAEYFVTRD